MLRDQLNTDLKTAMKEKDTARSSLVRMVLAELKMKDIESRDENNRSGISDAAILSMLEGMIKKRRESAHMYEQGGRPELAAKEQQEITLLQDYLPKQLSAEERQQAIQQAIAATGASGIKDMGKVMAELKSRYAGQMDMAAASGDIKKMLQ